MLPIDEQYYTYVNWAIEIIALDDRNLKELLNFRDKIRRLRIVSREDTPEWNYGEGSLLGVYTSLREFFIVCPEGLISWTDHIAIYRELVSWCKEEHVYLIEPDPGPRADWPPPRMARAMDVCAYSDKIGDIMWADNVGWEEAGGEAGHNYPFSGHEPTLEMVLAQPYEGEIDGGKIPRLLNTLCFWSGTLILVGLRVRPWPRICLTRCLQCCKQ